MQYMYRCRCKNYFQLEYTLNKHLPEKDHLAGNNDWVWWWFSGVNLPSLHIENFSWCNGREEEACLPKRIWITFFYLQGRISFKGVKDPFS